MRATAFLDAWSRIESPVHRTAAATKLTLALLTVLATAAVPIRFGWFFLVLGLALAGVAWASRIPLRSLAGRLLLLEPFVAGVALVALLQPRGTTIALAIVVRSTLCLGTAILLTNTTRFSDLLLVLRWTRMPALLLTTIALLYRYLFVLIEEAERMQRARASRTLFARRAHRWRSNAALAGQLFLRSTERAERIYAAMCARGWR